MTCTKWIQFIRDDKRLNRLYNLLTIDERHKLFEESDGETWNLLQIIENILEDRNEQR